MGARIFDEDPQAGLTRLWHYDDDTDTAVIETRQDVGDLVETNKKIHNEFDGERARWPGDWHRVASIPLNIYCDLKQKGAILPNGDVNQKEMKKWLNDRDNRFFRTRPGRI